MPRLALALALLLALAAHGLGAQSQTIVVEGGTLIDGNGGPPIRNSVIVIEGSRIKSAGPGGSVSYPPGATVIRAEGMTILPGLIDAHIHSLDFFPQLFLHFGVTTVFDTANPTEWVIAQRDAVKKGRMKGPRMFVTGVVIDGPDAAADRRDAYRTHVQTPEEARMVARGLLQRGVDGLKVYQNLTPALLQPIVEEAHKAGTEAVGHSHDARDAIAVGLKYIEHVTPIAHATLGNADKLKAMDEGRLSTPEADMNPALFGPLIDVMVKNGVYFNPTITRMWIEILPKRTEWYAEAAALLESPAYRFIPEARRQIWLRTARARETRVDPRKADAVRNIHEFTRRFVEAGGKVINGPDSGPTSGPANMAGLAMHVEMEALVDAGLTPMQAIQSSTKWAAEVLHKDGDLGTIAPGKIADLILIEGDPLADIRSTRKIRTVMMDGKIVDTTLDPNFRNPIPRPVAEYPMDSRDPEVESLTPELVPQGAATVRIEVSGKKFTPQSVIRFDRSDLPTTFVSESKLSATIKSSLLKNPGTYAVTVVNPGPAGGVSPALYLIVNFK
jgi:imidazolonepropionase-like amidohydrolase